jgi:hypothetical protein
MTAALRFCIFCLRAEGAVPWCASNPGDGCTYGCAHEFPCALCGHLLCKAHDPDRLDKPKQPPRKIDQNRCIKCDLHIKNPLAATNGCAHEYPAATPSPVPSA